MAWCSRATPAPAPPARPDPTPRRSLALAAIVGVVVVGVVLRLAVRSDLWLDEALTVNIARLPLGEIRAALRIDGAPPLYYFLLHGWMAVFGEGNLAVRSLPALLGILTLPLAYEAGRRIGGPESARAHRVGIVALLLVAASPYAIRYSTPCGNRTFSSAIFARTRFAVSMALVPGSWYTASATEGRPSNVQDWSKLSAPSSTRATSLSGVTAPSAPVLRMMLANCSGSTRRPSVVITY